MSDVLASMILYGAGCYVLGALSWFLYRRLFVGE